MPSSVRLLHKTLLNGRLHVYTSPDVAGLHASADTQAEAQRVAIRIVDLFAERDGVAPPTVMFGEQEPEKAAA